LDVAACISFCSNSWWV